MKQLLIDYNPYCVRVALTQDGELIDFSVERVAHRGLVGNIYKGKVENVLSGMKAAFVNIGLERNGFLYVGESLADASGVSARRTPEALNVSPGDEIMCQVVKDEFGTKGARLTTDVTLPGLFLVLLPTSDFLGISRKIEDDERRAYLEALVKSITPDGMGFIIRSAADKAQDDDIIDEADRLLRLWSKVQNDYWRAPVKTAVFREALLLERAIRDNYREDVEKIVINDARVAEHMRGKVGNADVELYCGSKNIMRHFGVAEQINRLSDRRVNMENGAYIVIDKTEALTVIDVNTGKFVGSKDLEDTVFKTNMLAAECVARQLRVRNISGIVIVDFIDMTKEEHRAALLEKLKAELKGDALKTTVVSMTGLGLVELTRKKARLPVDSFMLEPCRECMGGFIVSAEQRVFLLRDKLVDYTLQHKSNTITVRVHPDVFAAVFETRIMSREVTTLWKNRRIYFIPDKSVPRAEYEFYATDEKIVTLPRDARMLAY